LQGVLFVRDRIVAVNGAPLGRVTDPAALANKLGPLRRPVKITFERFDRTGGGGGGGGDLATSVFAEDFRDLSVGRLVSVFRKFAAAASGTLDTFELGGALAAVRGAAPTSRQVAELLAALRRDAVDEYDGGRAGGAPLTLVAFAHLALAFGPALEAAPFGPARRAAPFGPARGAAPDAASPRAKGEDNDDEYDEYDDEYDDDVHDGGGDEGSSDADDPTGLGVGVYELTFAHETLGFRVRSVASEGALVVSHVTDPALAQVVGLRDAVVAVNGVALGAVADPRAVQERIAREFVHAHMMLQAHMQRHFF
jgi:hypothetical protein